MNCSKCNSNLKDGAKFCTVCGTPVAIPSSAKNNEEAVALCKKCSSPLKPNAKFCNSCGERIEEQPQETNELSVVKQRIFWNVQKGEIAKKINESEFIQYDSVLGIIINDGTTAYVRSDGKQIAEIKGGVYNFIDPQELKKILESRIGGIPSFVKSTFKFAMNLVLGQKVKERIATKEIDPKQQESLDSIIACMKGDSNLLSLTLKMDKDFELIFGSAQSNADNYAEFSPMIIKTKYLDVNVGVRAIFKISDFALFSQHYLSDSSVVSTSILADKLTPIIKTAVQDVMYDIEQVESRLPVEVLDKILAKILLSSRDLMYGISLEKIVEITSNNEDLERFRALSRELYISESELDYLNRTNDFKNRLEAVSSDQEVHERVSELDLRKRLDAINKDGLLHEDELKKFTLALEVNEFIRTAHSEEEIETALIEIEKRGLLRVDEYNILADSVRKGRYDRDLTFDMLQIRGEGEKIKALTEVEKAELERFRQQRLGITDVEVEEQRLRDDYVIERNRKAVSAEMDLDERAADSSFERLRKIKDMEQREEDGRHKRDMERSSQEQQYRLKELETKYTGSQNLSPQQLMAIAANENLDPVAAAEFAKSFSANMNAEQQSTYMAEFAKLNQSRIDDKDKDADRMERMMFEMMSTARSMTGHLVQSKDDQKNEYKERMMRQEDRLDINQDRALDYATKNNIGTIPPPPPATQAVVYYIATQSGEKAPHSLQSIQQLVNKGIVQATTYVYPSNIANWVSAYTIKEIAHLFVPESAEKSIIRCSGCGANLTSGEKFCENCGKSIE